MKYMVIVAGLLLALVVIFYDQLTGPVTLAAWSLAAALVVLSFVLLAAACWLALEKIRLTRAQRREAEAKAVLTLTAGGQVFIRETNEKATWRALHLEQRVYANGDYHPPTEIEGRAWTVFHSPRTAAAGVAATPAAPIVTAPADLMTALDNVQRCLIVGASDVGKTTVLQWLVTRRAAAGRVVVIDPHAGPGKWPVQDIIGLGRNYAQIDRALSALVQLMDRRYTEIGNGQALEGSHPPVTILIDEWRAIVGNVQAASSAIKALLTESRKAAFSVFVASHSDRAKPLGLEGEYDLKDGFAIVRLTLVNGQRLATLDTGDGPQPVSLPGPFPAAAVTPLLGHPSMRHSAPAPTAEEQQVLEMLERGESYRAITRAVWGKVGSFYNARVNEIKAKYQGEK
jgi:hypothetical protein